MKPKKEKVNDARKNAKALKAQKKTQRDAKSNQDSGPSSVKKGGQKKGPSLINPAGKKKK
jgi:hypothetical protein